VIELIVDWFWDISQVIGAAVCAFAVATVVFGIVLWMVCRFSDKIHRQVPIEFYGGPLDGQFMETSYPSYLASYDNDFYRYQLVNKKYVFVGKENQPTLN
jgi:hypothetical protein